MKKNGGKTKLNSRVDQTLSNNFFFSLNNLA